MSTEHLEWSEVQDFSKGLWSASSAFLMPSDGFQTMENCYPQPGGGLRAFFAPSETTVTTITSTYRIIWLESFTSASETTFLALAIDPATGRMRAYTRTSGASSWTLSKTWTAPASAAKAMQAQACQYVSSAGVPYFAVAAGQYDGGSESGLFLYNINAGTWGSAVSGTEGITGVMVCMYQNRLMVRGVGVYNSNNRLMWTDPGGITIPAANYIDLGAEAADTTAAISAFFPYNPTNLMVATAASGWYSIQGDLGDPVVTQMGNDHAPNIAHGQHVARNEDGPIFIDPNGGLYVAQNNASSFSRLDESLTPFNPPASAGAAFGVEFYKGFLFAPDGRVRAPGGAWFTVSDGSGSSPSRTFHSVRYDSDAYGSFTSPVGLYAAQWADSFKIHRYVIDEALSAGRATSYTVKTAPLRGPEGRQAVMREIQVAVKSLNAEATVAVTVGGTTVTSAALGTGTNVVRFRFNKRAEYLDVQVVPASNTSGEAPLIEAIRIGHRKDGHYVQ